ncbi:hypothetical protein HGRIS_006924 [Hohenbuehelia grisea]
MTPLSSKSMPPEESDTDGEVLPSISPAVSSMKKPTHPLPQALHATLARSAFASCFTESSTMFFLLILQSLDFLSPRTRLLQWRFSLFLLMGAILIAIPILLSVVLTLGSKKKLTDNRTNRRRISLRLILNIVPVFLFLLGLSYIPLPPALSASDTMTAELSRLIVLGTIILGLLSGFGAVTNAWDFLPFRSRLKLNPTEHDVASAEYALSRVRNDLQERRAETLSPAGSQEPHQSTWYSRVIPNLRGDSELQEIKGLEALEYQMSRNLDALKRRRATALFSGTFRGRAFNIFGHLFAIYCIVRVISSFINIILPARSPPAAPTPATSSTKISYPDLITHFMAYLLAFIWSDVTLDDAAVISRQVSFVLVGVIILTSIRLVLRGVTKALRVTSRNIGASLMLLLLSQLMGIYLLSTIVQLRTTFPPPNAGAGPHHAEVTNLFETIPEYEVFGSLFDWSFLLAAGGSAFVLWGAEKMNGPN